MLFFSFFVTVFSKSHIYIFASARTSYTYHPKIEKLHTTMPLFSTTTVFFLFCPALLVFIVNIILDKIIWKHTAMLDHRTHIHSKCWFWPMNIQHSVHAKTILYWFIWICFNKKKTKYFFREKTSVNSFIDSMRLLNLGNTKTNRINSPLFYLSTKGMQENNNNEKNNNEFAGLKCISPNFKIKFNNNRQRGNRWKWLDGLHRNSCRPFRVNFFLLN